MADPIEQYIRLVETYHATRRKKTRQAPALRYQIRRAEQILNHIYAENNE